MDCRLSAVQQIYQLQIVGELLEIAFLIQAFCRAWEEGSESSWHGRRQMQMGLFCIYNRVKDPIFQVEQSKSSKEQFDYLEVAHPKLMQFEFWRIEPDVKTKVAVNKNNIFNI